MRKAFKFLFGWLVKFFKKKEKPTPKPIVRSNFMSTSTAERNGYREKKKSKHNNRKLTEGRAYKQVAKDGSIIIHK